jgi:acyl-CoA reductase-like NAD-dependent aldehyde dehydrogenase
MRVTQPYDGELIAEIPVHTPADIEAKLQNAVEVFASRSNWLPAFQRIEVLKRLARLVEDDREVLTLLIARRRQTTFRRTGRSHASYQRD